MRELHVENWKAVVGFEGFYEVSDLGRVRSIDRTIQAKSSSRSGAHHRTYRGQLLKPGRKSDRHLTVAVTRGNSEQVHDLVLRAFRGPPPTGHEGLHLNHNPADNRLENLRWGARSENLKQDYATGSRQHLKGPGSHARIEM